MFRKYCFFLLMCLSGAASAAEIRLTGSESVYYFLSDIEEDIKEATGHTLNMSSVGSSGGYKAAAGGQLGMASRLPKDQEKADNLQVLRIGTEALIIGVNFVNKIPDLSMDQVRGLFSGAITRWEELEPAYHHPVKLFGPETRHGSFLFFTKHLNLDAAWLAENAHLSRSHRQTLRYITTNPGDVGFFSYGAWEKLHRSYSEYVNMVSINKIKPEPETIKDGSYPLSQPLYFVVNRPLTSAEQDLVRYLQSR